MKSLGIDVSKARLSGGFEGQVREFGNTATGHRELLEWAPEAQTWCMEATGRYHGALADFACLAGKRCLVVNPGRAKQYLGFVASRAKTDRVDALALARLAEREGESLREYKPVPERIVAARDALVRRRAFVEARVALELTAQTVGDPEGLLAAAAISLKAAQVELEKRIVHGLKGYPAYGNLLTIPGVGPLGAALLVCALERGEFATSDSLVAFAGLDPRPNDSGKAKGVRTLSHQGDAQLRTVLFMAARAAARGDTWKPYYRSQLAKGLSTTAATVVLARKLIRVAWSVARQGSPFIQKNGPPIDKLT